MIDPDDDALVMRGDPATGSPMFRGPFTEACKFVWSVPVGERAAAYVLAGEVTYGPAELESMRKEDEGKSDAASHEPPRISLQAVERRTTGSG